jgi:hypothetical protein
MWKKIACFFPCNQVAPQPQEYALTQLEATNSSLKTTVEHKNALAAAQTRTISAQDTTIELQSSVIARQNSDIARLEECIEMQNSTMARQKSDIMKLQNFIAKEKLRMDLLTECREIREGIRKMKESASH